MEALADLDAGAIGLQLDHFHSAKVVDLLCERQVQHIIDVVLQHPLQVLVVLRVNCLNVLHRLSSTQGRRWAWPLGTMLLQRTGGPALCPECS